jgi:hypothetical protein
MIANMDCELCGKVYRFTQPGLVLMGGDYFCEDHKAKEVGDFIYKKMTLQKEQALEFVKANKPGYLAQRDAIWQAARAGIKTEHVVKVLKDHRDGKKEILGFDGPEDGSEERYDERKKEVPWATHTFWWVIHNCVAHVLIGVLPFRASFDLHDWTSRKMHGVK